MSRARTAPTRGFVLAGYALHSGEGWRGQRACGRGGAVSGSTQLNEAGRKAGRGEAANARELKKKRGSKETAGIRPGAGGAARYTSSTVRLPQEQARRSWRSRLSRWSPQIRQRALFRTIRGEGFSGFEAALMPGS